MADIKNKKQYRYFLYSQVQLALCESIEKQAGRIYTPGYVFVDGKKKIFTEISLNPQNNKYADGKLIAEGYIEDIKYQLPTRRRRA